MKKLLLVLIIITPLFTNAQLLINEVAPNNIGPFDDEDGEFSDWFEIYNNGPSVINVAGYAVTDNKSIWNKWLLPSIDINSGGREIIYASEKNRDCLGCGGIVNYMHTNFKLSVDETLYLFDDSGNLLDSIIIPFIMEGDAMARIPDGGPWCFADTRSADASNSGTCYTGYATTPIIITDAGFYTGSVDVEISGGEIYYTTNGDWPDFTDALYTTPINITSNSIIKAVQKETGKLPSRPATGSYFIDEETLLPVVSLTGRPCDFFDIAPCYIGAYDNANGWEPDNIQVKGTVEYFSADKTRQVNEDIKFEVAGNSSIAVYSQRSLQFTCDEDFNSDGEIQYNIFQHDKPGLDSLQGFRLRSNLDWGSSAARMKDLIVNRIALQTDAGAAAYQNVAAFINGEYWGHYSAREELDKYFLRNNFGCDPDKVDLIRSGAGEDVWDIAEAGSDTSYWNLVDWMESTDMTDPTNYAQALEKIDMENWIDYMATQVYVNNDEMAYNIRFFKSYEPEIKWRFILWDAGAGSEGETANSLQALLNFPYLSEEINLFDYMMDNTDFRNHFINRYADIMNYYYTPEIILGMIDENAAEIEAEIEAQHDRWGTGTPATWSNGVDVLKGFYDNRNYYQRNEIESYFDMNDQVDITIEVNPPGAGYIKISTIIPQELPWTGVYFDGCPVTISAIANPGYIFTNWSDNVFIDDETALSFTNNISDNTTFTANFNGSPIVNPVIISEINYNSATTMNSGDWIELYNSSPTPIDISDYIISNNNFYDNYKIPTNTILGANEYLVLAENLDEFELMHPAVTNVIGNFIFSLENDGDSITLKDHQNNIIKTFKFHDDQPWPITADGFGRTMEIVADIANPSFSDSWFAGCMGGSPGEAFTLCYENPVVEEINYNSNAGADAGDWFEIYNYTATDFDLSGWQIQDMNNNSYTVPAGTFVPGEGYLVFYQDATKFNAQFPTITNKVGPLNFGFSTEGDVIQLFDGTNTIYQSVGYDNVAPYPLSPNGGGTALQLLNTALNLNTATNWTESCPEGSPGSEYLLPCATNIDEETISAFAIYPNPAENDITILFPEMLTGETSIMIVDLTGKILMANKVIQANSIQLNIENFAPGIYFVQIQNANDFVAKSFVKE